MKTFLEKHDSRITGVLACFDRMQFLGYSQILSGFSNSRPFRQCGLLGALASVRITPVLNFCEPPEKTPEHSTMSTLVTKASVAKAK